jgi:hypothetical protein
VCAQCDATARTRTEHVIRDLLLPMLRDMGVPPPSAMDNVRVATCVALGDCTFRRPDTCWLGTDRVVHYECDENSHVDRMPSCELSKLDETVWGAVGQKLPTIIIRFNPDAFDGKTTCTNLTDRVRALARCIHQHCTRPVDTLFTGTPSSSVSWKRLKVIYMFYHSTGHRHIENARRALSSATIHICNE